MDANSRHLVSAATILGVAGVVGCVVLVVGMWLALDRAAGRLARSMDAHAAALREAGTRVGDPVGAASDAIDRHARALAAGSALIARPEIKIVDPVPIAQPVEIRGIGPEGTLPVDASLAK